MTRSGRAWRAAILLLGALALLPHSGLAQTAPLPQGSAIPQGSPLPRVAPAPPQGTVPAAPPAPLPPPQSLPAASVAISAVVIEGATAYPAATLQALTAGLVGPRTSLQAIETARRAVLLRYRDDGYPFITVAARRDAAGVLHISVAEGYIADVKLSGKVGPAGTLVLRFLNHLVGRQPINTADIEYWLLLAQSIPGLDVQPVVQATEGKPGAFTLIAGLKRKSFSGSLSVDNRAYHQTGAGEGLLTLGVNSQTQWGERTEAALFLAGPSGRQIFGQANEQFFLGGSGLSVRLYGGHGSTQPCCDLARIGYDGQTTVFGLQLSYPLLLSRQHQLYLRGGFDALDLAAFENDTRASGDSLRILRLQADDSLSDLVLGGDRFGDTRATLRLSHGLSALGASANGRANAGRLNANLHFTKADGEVSRDQTVAILPDGGPRLSLYGLAAAQASGDILPSAEQFYLGGLRYTRGFYAGEVSGDQAVALTAEVRLSFQSAVTLFGQSTDLTSQLYGFYDWGETWQNQATDAKHLLRSFGIGLRTSITPNLRLELEALDRITRQVGGAHVRPEPADAIYTRIVTTF